MLKYKLKNQPIRLRSGQAGFSLLLTIVLIVAISISIAVSILLIGIDSSKTSFANQQANHAKAIANACAEEALQEIRDSVPFSGYGNLVFSQGSCGYFVTNSGGQNRNIVVSSTVGTMVRKVEIDIDTINPQINISSWQEVATLSGE
ncbi:MAG: hypothetical protein HOE19_01475 [Candidatus Komeilibacteria bacterium]|jgi:hypothetical protein|nr:hypothetical protein [Candidatus Komeilibacteria bacterium]MBT4448052.1 hypothetical protein [Candidatus Komeilibacteria bacterium]